ncbi:MAG TPA: Ger(x)C family spore germination protein [Syntrophomonadaceae bacterium]|nr:Ger(x)C family spore germination protein [Syntrophomonadaceae bacterium]HRX20563.1 Ger(x)C family spore germination protein [Syntrophomonadaceae bacterium]
MKNRQQGKISLVILLSIISVFIVGCWDSRELSTLSLIAGLGFDLDPATKRATLTYQSIVPSQVKPSPSMGGGEGKQTGSGGLQSIQLDHDTGLSPYEVLNRYTQHGSRIPFYQHTQVIVIGKAAAEHGLYPFLDTVIRNPAGRPNILLAISDNKASDILAVEDGMENIQAVGMANIIKLSARFSKYPAVTCLDFTSRFIGKTTAPVAPIMGVFEETGPEGKRQKKIRINGTAVFKGDKMIGKLNEQESSGLLWVINQIEKGFVIIPEASLEIIGSKTKIIPELTGGKIKITVEIEEEANLIQYNNARNITPDLIHQLEKAQAREIESQVKAVIKKSMALNADIFDFGGAVHRKYKKEWKKMEPRWDDIYPTIEVSVKVKTRLDEIGDINKAIMTE